MENIKTADFSNQNIDEDQVTIENIEFSTLSKKYATSRRWLGLLVCLTYSTLVLFFTKQTWIAIPNGLLNAITISSFVISGGGLLITFYCHFADPCKAYNLREQDISYRCGLIFSKVISQPILRIQHVELKRGPIDRKLGLAKLQVFSAGGALHTFEIPGLELEKAEQLRQFILSHKDLTIHG